MVKKICGFLRTIILLCLIVLVGLMYGPKLLGYDSLVVLSGSMEPGIHVGSVVLVKPATYDDVKIGDIVTYSIAENTNVTHRVIEIDTERELLTTKGDANETQDLAPVAAAQIVGKVEATIPYIGYISVYIKTGLGIGVICGLLIVIILLSTIPEMLEKDEADEKEKEEKEVNLKK